MNRDVMLKFFNGYECLGSVGEWERAPSVDQVSNVGDSHLNFNN